MASASPFATYLASSLSGSEAVALSLKQALVKQLDGTRRSFVGYRLSKVCLSMSEVGLSLPEERTPNHLIVRVFYVRGADR